MAFWDGKWHKYNCASTMSPVYACVWGSNLAYAFPIQ